jgi:hypothetical protein
MFRIDWRTKRYKTSQIVGSLGPCACPEDLDEHP